MTVFEPITAEQANVGDMLRISYHVVDAQCVVTGLARDIRGTLHVGVTPITPCYIDSIEREIPDWKRARVIEVRERTFARVDNDTYAWIELGNDGGGDYFSDHELARATEVLGARPTIIVAEDGTVKP